MGLPKAIIDSMDDISQVEDDEVYMYLVSKFRLEPITNEAENDAALEIFGKLLSLKRTVKFKAKDLTSINRYLNGLKVFIRDFEKNKYKFDAVDGADILQELIERNNLTQSDLEKEIGKQPVVSKILNRKASLSAQQIGNLCKRFNLSADVFYAGF